MSNPSQVLRVVQDDAGKVPTAEVSLVSGDGSPLFLFGSGAPVNAARAALSHNPAGDDNALTFTAKEYGAGGNDISVAYVNPGANNAPLTVSVSGKDITVSLATGGGGSISSTAAQVKAAIEGHAVANALVTVAIDTSDSGLADDGSGVVTALTKANLTGGVGSFIGVARKGVLYVDETTPDVYINVGTKSVPSWKKITRAT